MKFSLLEEVYPEYKKIETPQNQEQQEILCKHCARNKRKNQIEKFSEKFQTVQKNIPNVEIENDFDIVLILLLAFIAYVILNPR